MSASMVVVAFTSDFEGLSEFYEGALGMKGTPVRPNWLEFPMGDGARFALHRRTATSENDQKSYHLNFTVSDISAAVDRFKSQGAHVVRGVADESFGRSATLRDPDGRTFDLVEEEH